MSAANTCWMQAMNDWSTRVRWNARSCSSTLEMIRFADVGLMQPNTILVQRHVE